MVPGQLTMAFCGDIMLGAEVGEYIGSATVSEWVAEVASAWRAADLLIGNLECPCVVEAKPIDHPLPEIVFRAPASRLAELKDAGFTALTLANNHILNCGSQGLLETIRGLDAVGIYHTGAGMNLAEALEPAFISAAGLTVGLVAFSYAPAATRSQPGVAPCEPRLMIRALSAARARADLVVAALHDGLEYSDVPPSKTRARFLFLAQNGADVVVGHHPHVLQGLEWYGNVPIACSLGDFLFHNSLPHVVQRNFSRIAMARHAPEEALRDPGKFARGAVLTVQVIGEKKSIHWYPFRQTPNLRPRLSSGSTLTDDLQRLRDLSTVLVNQRNPRHKLADSVYQTAWWETRDSLSIREIVRLAVRPKWRYLPAGLRWLYRRLSAARRAH